MFEEYFTELFTLLNPVEVRDGAPVFSAVKCCGRTVGNGTSRKNPDDTPVDCSEVILLSSRVAPLPGCRLRRNGTEYAVGTVQSCQTLDGSILCYRCTVL